MIYVNNLCYNYFGGYMDVLNNLDTYFANDMFRLGFLYGVIFICVVIIVFTFISKLSLLLDKKINDK